MQVSITIEHEGEQVATASSPSIQIKFEPSGEVRAYYNSHIIYELTLDGIRGVTYLERLKWALDEILKTVARDPNMNFQLARQILEKIEVYNNLGLVL